MSMAESTETTSAKPADTLDIVLWLDAGMMANEGPFVRHLVMGLKSEGHRVTFVAPADLDLTSLPTLGSRTLTYRWNRWERLSFLQRMRLADVIEELTEDLPDVILAWGTADPLPLSTLQSALPVLSDQPPGIPMVVWCWDASELFTPLMALPQVRHAIVPSEPIQSRVPTDFRVPVTLIHPGVYCDDTQACYDVPEQVACLVSLDPLSQVPAYESLIRACKRLADDHKEFLLFAYDTGHAEHPIWRLAEKIGLLDRLSFVPFQQEAEPLLMHGDLYLHVLPAARVQYRTLEAMSKGLCVVASPNHAADYLRDEVTCRIVPEASVDAWHRVLLKLLDDRPYALNLARHGQQLMRERHEMTRMITQFTGVCRRAAGTPLRLVSV